MFRSTFTSPPTAVVVRSTVSVPEKSPTCGMRVPSAGGATADVGVGPTSGSVTFGLVPVVVSGVIGDVESASTTVNGNGS